MVVVMSEGATDAQIEAVVAQLVAMGFDVHRSTGAARVILGAVGGNERAEPALIELLDGVREVVRITEPFKLASRSFRPEGTVVTVGDVRIGGDEVVVMAGPVLGGVRGAGARGRGRRRSARGAKILRGGAFKPRSSPYSFQGLGEEGLRLLRWAADEQNLKVVSEVMDVVADRVAGAVRRHPPGRRAQHAELHAAARAGPSDASRCCSSAGIAATIEEWLLSAEYVLAGGNSDVILCERGIRTFENYTRNTLDISAIPVVKKLSHLPIIADPSHGTGRRDKVAPMARAAVAAGADGLIIEVHCDPDHALSDGAQSLFPAQFDRLMAELRIIAPAIGRSICVEPVARRGWAR